jgi:hypothetical protein
LRLFSRLTERLACAPALGVRRLAAAFVRGRKTGQWPVRRAPGWAPLRRRRSAAGREGAGLDGVSPHRGLPRPGHSPALPDCAAPPRRRPGARQSGFRNQARASGIRHPASGIRTRPMTQSCKSHRRTAARPAPSAPQPLPRSRGTLADLDLGHAWTAAELDLLSGQEVARPWARVDRGLDASKKCLHPLDMARYIHHQMLAPSRGYIGGVQRHNATMTRKTQTL